MASRVSSGSDSHPSSKPRDTDPLEVGQLERANLHWNSSQFFGRSARRSAAGSETTARLERRSEDQAGADSARMFLMMMYCLERRRVRDARARLRQKETIGVIVPTICRRSRRSVARMKSPKMRPSPPRIQVARRGCRHVGGMAPNVRIWIVRVARSWAGAEPGKNFSTRNQKKTIPQTDAKERNSHAAMTLVTRTSSGSNQAGAGSWQEVLRFEKRASLAESTRKTSDHTSPCSCRTARAT